MITAFLGSAFSLNEVTVQNILITALLAFSVQVTLRAGVFSLAGIGFYAIGSYMSGLLVKDGWPVVLGIAAAVVASGALAGALHALAFTTVLPTDAGFSTVVLALTMVIIGGQASWVGAMLGVVVLTWLPLKLTFVGQWWDAVYGGVLIIIACYAPEGFL